MSYTLNSGGSRGGSMGSMEPLFWRAAFENTMRKYSSYTMLTLELRTSASTAANYSARVSTPVSWIRRAHALRACTYILPEACGSYRDDEQTAKRVRELMHCSLWLLSYRDGARRYAISMRALIFPRPTRITSCSAARNGVTPLILLASNTMTRFSNRSSSFCNFTLRIHCKNRLVVLTAEWLP